jgi:integrase
MGDLPEARAYAHRLLATLMERRPTMQQPAQRGRPRQVERKPELGGPLTLGRLVELYQVSAAFKACAPGTQQDRTGAFRIMLDFVDPGSTVKWSALPAVELDPEKVQALVTAWSTGAYRHHTSSRDRVRMGRIRNALAYLRTACNWAYTTRVGGKRLLGEKVFEGIPLPVEQNPMQPRMADGTLDQLLAVAERFPTTGRHVGSPPGPSRFQFQLLLRCAEAWGNRVNALLHLRPEDFDWPNESVWWNPVWDKMGKGRSSYVPPDIADAIKAELERAGRPETPWLFFAPNTPERPLSEGTARTWLVTAYELLRLTRPEGLGYHSLRRKWRSDRDDQPLKAVMEEGGWSSVEAAMRYAKPNREERKAVALSGHRVRNYVQMSVKMDGECVTKSPDKSPISQDDAAC